MEDYIDLVTSSFQATVAVLAVCGAGYLFSGADSSISKLVRVFMASLVTVPDLFVIGSSATQ
jgi:hypothetical protein